MDADANNSNQLSVAKAFQEFDDLGRMKHSPFYDRVVDVMEELVKFTLLTRDRATYLVHGYSERKKPQSTIGPSEPDGGNSRDFGQ